MEALIQALQSGDMKTRLAASEQFYNKLRQKASIDSLQVLTWWIWFIESWDIWASLDIKVLGSCYWLLSISRILANASLIAYMIFIVKQYDAKNIVVSNCLALSEETNLKLCLIGLDCLQTLIENQTESFQPYLDMTFDLLIDKFADIQVNCRRIWRVTRVSD